MSPAQTKRRSKMVPILVVVVIVVGGVIGFIAMQPTDFQVVRSTTVNAPAEIPFAQVNDFHKWTAWNPWGKLDPGMELGYEGAEAGEGAKYWWKGNGQVGEGRMTIIESRPYDAIHIRMEFVKPMAGLATAEFTFKPEGEGTKVTWRMIGTNNFVAKAMGLFMNMDKMIGEQFEKGLADIKAVSESGTPA